MKLIKDFQNYQFIYFWYSAKKGRLSPIFPTMEHASEWRQKQIQKLYTGSERRQNHTDNLNLNRRQTDKPVQVNVDVASEKVARLRAQFESRAA